MATRKKKSTIKTHHLVVGALMGTAVVGGAIYAHRRREQGLPILPFQPQPALPPAPSGWPPPEPPPETSTTSSSSKYVANRFPLRQWMKGERVRQLQQALVGKGQRISVDGYWGPQTQRAVSALGIPTPITQAALQALKGGSSSVAPTIRVDTAPAPGEASVSERIKNVAVSTAVDGEVENSYFKARPYAFAKKMTKVFTEPVNRKTEITRIQAGDYIGQHLGKSFDLTVKGTKVRFARVRLRADKFPDKEGWVWSGTIESRTTGPGTSGLLGISGLAGVLVTAPTFLQDELNRQVEVLPNTLIGEAIGVRNGMVAVRAKDGSEWQVSKADVMIT